MTNGFLALSHNNRWQLAMDNPLRTCQEATAGLAASGTGGRFDFNGHDLYAGEWTGGQRWLGSWFSKLVPQKGEFFNNAQRFSTLYNRQMSSTKLQNARFFKIMLNGRMNLTLDEHNPADGTEGTAINDYDGSWPLWVGNWEGETSTMCGTLKATRGALHIAPGADFPNVARIIAQDTGAVYVHDGAKFNPDVMLCVEGKGRIHLVQDVTVASIYRDGERLRIKPGVYTTDDFDFIFPNSGAASGVPEGVTRKVTVTGKKRAVARVGMTPYLSFEDAENDANGGVTVRYLFNPSATNFTLEAKGLWLDPATGEESAPPRVVVPGQSGFLVEGLGDEMEPVPPPGEVMEICGMWRIEWKSAAPGAAPRTFETEEPYFDWTKSADGEVRHFSGTAKYSVEFDCADAEGVDALELGDLRGQCARVTLNGVRLGTAWAPPFRLGVKKGALRSAGNRLEIEYANVWANRLIGDEKHPRLCERKASTCCGREIGSYPLKYPGFLATGKLPPGTKRRTFSMWNYFNEDSPLVPSGLAGPVRLVRAAGE